MNLQIRYKDSLNLMRNKIIVKSLFKIKIKDY